MNKIKVIDLLNMISKGEEVPKKIRINGWCYKFEWQDYAGNYLDESEEIDLMSALSCDKEELNKEVEILDDEDEEKESLYKPYAFFEFEYTDDLHEIIKKSNINFKSISEKVNEIIYYLEKQRKGE